jgi:hypothetical protein
MQRVLVFILSLIVATAPALPVGEGAPRRAESGCCGGESAEPCCPLCAELHRQTGHCPCSPAPERPSGAWERDQSAAAPTAARRIVVRSAKVAETLRPVLWSVSVATTMPRRVNAVATVARPQPLRAAMCVWTT